MYVQKGGAFRLARSMLARSPLIDRRPREDPRSRAGLARAASARKGLRPDPRVDHASGALISQLSIPSRQPPTRTALARTDPIIAPKAVALVAISDKVHKKGVEPVRSASLVAAYLSFFL